MKIAIALSFLLPSLALAAADIGKPAPAFKLQDVDGKERSLSEFKGKTVVLEWFNFGCPFVRKHYDSKNMQKLQEQAAKDGVAWLSIVSSAKGKQGYAEPAEAKAEAAKEGMKSAAVLRDPEGTVGKAYGAKSTPHMYIIDDKGILRYRGAIDDKPSTDVADIATAKNYVTAALGDLKAKRAVATSDTPSYGCGIKYK